MSNNAREAMVKGEPTTPNLHPTSTASAPPPPQTLKPDPTIKTEENTVTEPKKYAPHLNPAMRVEFKELFSQPYMLATRDGKPPNPELVEAGEKAMRELGLFSPVCPSLHVNPSWNPLSNPAIAGDTREFWGMKAVEYRTTAQKYAHKAAEWREKRDELLLSGSLRLGRGERKTTVREESQDERAARRKRWRRAGERFEWYEEQSMVWMAKAYVQALMAVNSRTGGETRMWDFGRRRREF